MNEDQPRDSHGRWAAGGSVGRQPVQSSAGAVSVHARLSAKAETIARGKKIDERFYPTRSNADVSAITDRGMPAGARTTPGRMDPRINDRARSIISKAGG